METDFERAVRLLRELAQEQFDAAHTQVRVIMDKAPEARAPTDAATLAASQKAMSAAFGQLVTLERIQQEATERKTYPQVVDLMKDVAAATVRVETELDALWQGWKQLAMDVSGTQDEHDRYRDKMQALTPVLGALASMSLAAVWRNTGSGGAQ